MAGFSYPGVMLALFVFSVLVERYIKKNRDNPAGLPLPPGPPRLPIVGNLFGIKDLGAQWLTYAEWGRKYGSSRIRIMLMNKVSIMNDRRPPLS
jgi:hypothetical protein